MQGHQFLIGDHAAQRMSQRNVEVEDVAAVLRFGRLAHVAGAEFYFLGKRDIPKGREREFERVVGVTVVLMDGHVITVYRNKHAPGKIKRKLKRFIARRGRSENSAALEWLGRGGEWSSSMEGAALRVAFSNERREPILSTIDYPDRTGDYGWY